MTRTPPRASSERMIANNYEAMQYVRRIVNEPLTPAIVLELQRILTDETLDEPDAVGRFRRADEEIVEAEGGDMHPEPRIPPRVRPVVDAPRVDLHDLERCRAEERGHEDPFAVRPASVVGGELGGQLVDDRQDVEEHVGRRGPAGEGQPGAVAKAPDEASAGQEVDDV